MANKTRDSVTKCLTCGFEAPQESDEREEAAYPQLGTLTQCPDCGSTGVHTQG